MMKRNWIVLVFATLALASCSVEKRVYQPGYHIEWNHFAKQDQFQDVSQDRSEGASQDLFQDAAQGRSEGASQGFQENFEIASSQDLPQDLSENLETDVSQGRSEGASQALPKDLS